jgi:hypothetical protein
MKNIIKYALFAAFVFALASCEDMNSVNQEYLDRGESAYIAKIDSVISDVGLNKVWFKWWIPGDPRIAKTEIRWIEGIETKAKEYPVDRSQIDTLAMETVFENFPEGSYTFEFINLDAEGHRSLGVSTTIEVIGDRYRSGLRNRPISIATKFGNGYALVWGASDCIYSDLSYKTVDGRTVNLQLPSDAEAGETPRMLVYDSDGSGFTQTTYYLYKTETFEEVVAVPASIYSYFNDVSGMLTSSETTILRPGDFDLGGEGIGFHDSNTGHDPGSGGANYRPNLGDFGSAAMDIEGDGGNIGYSNPGEWVQYTVEVVDEDFYEIDWYISVNNSSGSACRVEVDGSSLGSYPLVNNGDWSSWRYYCERNNVIPPYLRLTKGKHTVRFIWEAGGFNFNGLRIRKIDPNHIVLLADRTGWTAESRNGNHDWGDGGGGLPEQVLDGDLSTGWHSQASSPLPQCMVVDMKKSIYVDHITLQHLPNGLSSGWIYYKDVEIYLTDTPVTPDIYQPGWGSPVATYVYPGGIDPISITLNEGSKGRYLILYFPTSRSNTYISFAELNVYELIK